MHSIINKQKKSNFLKKNKELDLKIDSEKEKIKHNNKLRNELDNINASYNRCLDILSKSASGKNINKKYNNLYTENRINYIKNVEQLDSQISQSQNNIDAYLNEKDNLKKEDKED